MSGGQPEYRGNAAQSEAVVTGICASYTASVAARNTLTGTEIRRGRHASDSAQITCQDPAFVPATRQVLWPTTP